MRRGVFLATAAALAAATVCTAAGGVSPTGSTLVVIANPSSQAHAKVSKHMKDIIRAVVRPHLTVLAMYEQRGSDDPKPFGSAFLQLPPYSPTTSPILGVDCSERDTDFKRTRCEKQKRAALDELKRENAERRRTWLASALKQAGNYDHNGSLDSPKNRWNLKGTLAAAGYSLALSTDSTKCIVLLGGLAVQPPPQGLNEDLAGRLKGVTVVVAGWRTGPAVERAWRDALGPATPVVFIPEPATELFLIKQTLNCLAG